MDKIAIISDIHSNLEALKSVLESIRKRGINKIYCLGDIIAKGVHAHECVELIKENCEIVLQGNCDEVFSSNVIPEDKPEIEIKRFNWNRGMLTKEDVNFLKNLPFCHEFYMSGRLVRLFHATPKVNNDFVGNIDSLEKLNSLFCPSDKTISQDSADVVIYGHIHTGFMQRIYNRTIVNAGSVGNSLDVFRNEEKDGDIRNTSVANYAIITGKLNSKDFNNDLSFELVNVYYDIEKELSSNKLNIEKEAYEEEIRNGKYRDMEKIYKSFEIRGIDKDSI